MADRPELRTDRLLLRPFILADAPVVQRLAGDRDIASTTLSIPHPYEDGMAEQWINTLQEGFERGEFVNFAIVLLADGALIGAIGLSLNQAHENAELGYWIGKPYWGNGYCTEAARAVLHYGFTRLGLNRVAAHHLSRNPASGRVMEKIGMQYEGCERQRVKKWGVFEDVKMYAILKDEYESRSGSSLSYTLRGESQ
jgi:ribosomal-protein-alanine N-acetyltransferase